MLDGSDNVFATLRIVTRSGNTNRAVMLSPSEDGTLEAVTQIPVDAVYLRASFATRWAVDRAAGFRSLIYDDRGEPVAKARAHSAFWNRETCLDVVATELAAYPDS